MPSKRAWFHQLPEILDVLRSLDRSHLDRHGFEQFFGVVLSPPPTLGRSFNFPPCLLHCNWT